MQQITQFKGPDPEDYENVTALNAAFIAATSTLRGPQRGRLAATPFFLFSLRETDHEWWQQALKDNRQRDLIADATMNNVELQRIQTAAIGFIWQLAKRNAYSARIISGATIAWCEQIVALPLLTLLDRVGHRGDLIESRLFCLGQVGDRLIGNGTSSSRVLRRSSHVTALQTLLTVSGSQQYVRSPAAACRLSGPAQIQAKKV